MSYILDALRRAEAERERGAVPGLQSQQHSIEGEDDAPERSRLLVWVVIALAFALIATLAWTLLGGSGAPTRPIAEGPVTPAPAAAPVATAAPVAAPLSVPVPVPMPIPMPATLPTPRPATATVKAAPPVALAAP